jgi:hypothetical protein
MLLFLPVAILVLTCATLGASVLQSEFRSSWLVALAGAALAWISLLYLRLQLPLTLTFPAWGAGELEYSATFVLDGFSWPLAFAISSLLVAALLGGVRSAVMASWVTWAPGILLTSACLLASLSGDPVTFLFTWTLMDVVGIALHLSELRRADERRPVLQHIPILLLGSFFLLAAWMFSFYGRELASVFVFISASLRLGLWSPPIRVGSPEMQGEPSPVLRLAPLAASLPLLLRADSIAEPARSILMLLVLLPAVYASGRWLLTRGKSEGPLWELGQASMVAAAALGGQGQAALAFSLVLLLGQGLLPIVQQAPRFRFLIAVLALMLLSGLPFTAGILGSGIYAKWTSPLVFAFLPIQAALLAGWLLRAVHAPAEPLPAEPWMRSIQWLGYATLPLVFILLGIGLLPSLAGGDPAFAWWAAVVTLVAAAFLSFVFRSGKRQLHPRAELAFGWVFSMRWLRILVARLAEGLRWMLNLLSGLLEGPAGVLWALLFMALLLSLAGQYGLGS